MESLCRLSPPLGCASRGGGCGLPFARRVAALFAPRVPLRAGRPRAAPPHSPRRLCRLRPLPLPPRSVRPPCAVSPSSGRRAGKYARPPALPAPLRGWCGKHVPHLAVAVALSGSVVVSHGQCCLQATRAEGDPCPLVRVRAGWRCIITFVGVGLVCGFGESRPRPHRGGASARRR